MPDYVISYMLKETDPDLHSKFKYEAMNKGFSDRVLCETSNNQYLFLSCRTQQFGEHLKI